MFSLSLSFEIKELVNNNIYIGVSMDLLGNNNLCSYMKVFNFDCLSWCGLKLINFKFEVDLILFKNEFFLFDFMEFSMVLSMLVVMLFCISYFGFFLIFWINLFIFFKSNMFFFMNFVKSCLSYLVVFGVLFSVFFNKVSMDESLK